MDVRIASKYRQLNIRPLTPQSSQFGNKKKKKKQVHSRLKDHILAKMARNPFDLEKGESRAKKIQETIHSAHRGWRARASISVDVFVLLAVPPRKKDLPAPG